MLLSSEEDDRRQSSNVDMLPYSCQAAALPYCLPFQAEAEILHENADLNNVEIGSNSDIVSVSSEVPVPVTTPILDNNSDVDSVSSELPVSVTAPALDNNSDIVIVSSEPVPVTAPQLLPKCMLKDVKSAQVKC